MPRGLTRSERRSPYSAEKFSVAVLGSNVGRDSQYPDRSFMLFFGLFIYM